MSGWDDVLQRSVGGAERTAMPAYRTNAGASPGYLDMLTTGYDQGMIGTPVTNPNLTNTGRSPGYLDMLTAGYDRGMIGATATNPNLQQAPLTAVQKANGLTDNSVSRLQSMYTTMAERQNPYQVGGDLYNQLRDNAHADIKRKYTQAESGYHSPMGAAQAQAHRLAQLGAASEMSRSSAGLAQRFGELAGGWQGQQDGRMMQLEGLMQSGYGRAFDQLFAAPSRQQSVDLGAIQLNSARDTQPFIDANTIAQAKLGAQDAMYTGEALTDEYNYNQSIFGQINKLGQRFDNFYPVRKFNEAKREAAPIIGTAAGAILGGPAGAAIGGQLGSAVGGGAPSSAGIGGLGGATHLPGL